MKQRQIKQQVEIVFCKRDRKGHKLPERQRVLGIPEYVAARFEREAQKGGNDPYALPE